MMKKRIRLFNFLIDSVLFFLIVLIISFLMKNYIERDNLKWLMIIFYYLYYFIFELAFGQTIGKMITKTKIIDIETQSHPKVFKIFIRTLSRLIPIDFISYLFIVNGFHDILSQTKTIKIN